MIDGTRVLTFRRPPGDDHEASFLKAKRLAFWVRNASSSTVHLRSVSVQLESEQDSLRSEPSLVTRSEPMDDCLPPGAWQSVELTVIPPLTARPGSNSWTAHAEFQQVGPTGVSAPQSERQDLFDWINLRDAPAHPDAEVFVSFVDPENDELAQLAELYLRRAGIRPYLAKRETRIGCDYWEGKIMPAIARASGMLVIWTGETIRRPESVVREIEYAQTKGTPVGLFRAHETELPRLYPQSVKEYVGFDPHEPRSAFAHAIAAGASAWRMTGRFFG